MGSIAPPQREETFPPSILEGRLNEGETGKIRLKINEILESYPDLVATANRLYDEGRNVREVYEELKDYSVERAERQSRPSLSLVGLANAVEIEDAELLDRARISSIPAVDYGSKTSGSSETIPPPKRTG